MKSFSVALIALATVFAFAPGSASASTIAFNVTVPGLSISGYAHSLTYSSPWIVVATPNGRPADAISLTDLTDVTGTKNYDFTGAMFQPEGIHWAQIPASLTGYDENIFTGGPGYGIDGQGVLFHLLSGPDILDYVLIVYNSKTNEFDVTLYKVTGNTTSGFSATELAWEDTPSTQLSYNGAYIADIPEPPSMFLLGSGLLLLAALFYWKGRAASGKDAQDLRAA